MFHINQTTRTLRASVTTTLCAALLSTGAMAANVTLQTIDVTPAAKTISGGQKQTFTATGTFSNGSKQALGPAISSIAAGGWGSTCAVLISGGVECWGHNNHGQLGVGHIRDLLVPGSVKGISTATTVAFGTIHACALLATGEVKCWGFEQNLGTLGTGENIWQSPVPVSVTGISTATALSAGWEYSCALLASGVVQCWGLNDRGQLGDGSNSWSANVPVSVAGISSATKLASGQYHSCVLLASGKVQCWGSNYNGQLGNGITGGDSHTPVTVSGINNATAVAAGGTDVPGGFSCALLASGSVQCWGKNDYGQLGNGSNVDSNVPVFVSGIRTAIAITAGLRGHACAVLRNGSVKCWGWNANGQLGDGTTTSSNTPVLVRAINGPTVLTAGGTHTCSLFSGGMTKCWGSDQYGELGNRKTVDSALPVAVVGTPGVVWRSSDASRATITDRGVATGRAVGNTTISATTAGFINDNAVLTVK